MKTTIKHDLAKEIILELDHLQHTTLGAREVLTTTERILHLSNDLAKLIIKEQSGASNLVVLDLPKRVVV